MSRNQKFALFNLFVVATAAIVVFSLAPILGWQRAHGGMGILGLTGFGVLFFRKKPGQVITDERDILIQQRAQSLAFAILWLVFVAVTVGLAPAVYGWEGAIPVTIVQMSVWWAWIIVYGVISIATLVQYIEGSKNVE